MRRVIDIVEAAQGHQILQELTMPPSFREAHYKLAKSGWSFISHGKNGEIYGRDDRDYVLKLFTTEDVAYTDFVNLVMKHRGNPHFPKIKGNGIVKVTGSYDAVRIERLVESTRDSYPTMLPRYLVNKRRGSNKYAPLDYPPGEWEKVDAFFKKNPLFKEALDLIAENLFPQHSADLHHENIMRRVDGTLVITDPVV